MVHYFRLFSLALLLSVGVGSVGKAGSNNVVVVNEVTELEFSYLETIPLGPLPSDFYSACSRPPGHCRCNGTIIEPVTLNGKIIFAKSWGVLSEQSLGPFEFVSFAGEFQDGLSGSCIVNQGNVAIFKAGELVGVIYTSSKDDELIGKLWIAEGGVVQLSTPHHSPWVDITSPWADIKILKDKIKIEYRASVQSFCNGSVIVPKIVGEPISEARKTLIEFAWEPITQTEEGSFSFIEGMRKSGIVETIECTASGFCSFEYQRPNRYLWVQSYLDTPNNVLDYGVSCEFQNVDWPNLEVLQSVLPSICQNADSEGRTPLHYLVKQERPSKLEALLQDNSDLNCADNYGETPLHFAAALGTSEIVSLLLKYGSNTNVINKGGETPLDLALGNPLLMTGTSALTELAKMTTIVTKNKGLSIRAWKRP